MARLSISRLKNDVKQMANKNQTLQISQEEFLLQQEESEKQLAQSKLLVQQVDYDLFTISDLSRCN